MRPQFRRRKIILVATLAGLLAADAGLAVYSVRTASETKSPQQQLDAQSAQLRLLRADVKRAHEIEQDMPKTRADCERFESSLPRASGGYSALSAELESVSRKAGLQIAALNFHPKEIVEHGVTEVTVDATVNGDYQNVVQFLNGLQRSPNYYIVDDLTLVTSTGGAPSGAELKVNLHLRSYFKAGA
jgi:Tfp pilus assembly protein PilO